MKSSTDKDEPIRTFPKSEKLAPKRATLRMDIDDPRCKKSKTDKAEPKRTQDLRENVDPI
jgi:hypothetical protein